MKTQFFMLVFITAGLSTPATGDESLAHCSAKKTQQMELTRKMRSGTKSAKSTHRRSQQSRGRQSDMRQRSEDIDDWLWRNCRNHAEEMRTIEQQYM